MLLFLPFLPLVAGWGSLGHRTVAYLAQLHFTPTAHLFTNSLLNGQDISEAALFPDKIVHIPQFAYTAGWHYIDAQDDPPRQCGINITRDCLDGCVVSAIANHTSRVMAPLSHLERGQSMRFVLHFFGDIHQPLHTENEDRGGNEIHVVFDGKHTNLHSVWDTLMPNKYAGGVHEKQAAAEWAKRLYNDERLVECLDDAAECALEWANEANKWVCDYVLKDDILGLPDDLGGDYYNGATSIIDEQIMKAGRRLAAWINAMSDGGMLVGQ
jgi:hypothetical protein